MGASQSKDNSSSSSSIRRDSSSNTGTGGADTTTMSTTSISRSSNNADTTTTADDDDDQQQQQLFTTTSSPPPKMGKVESIEDKVYRKFSKQPLVPIGCAATAYFLVSGIKSFQKRDPVRSQRMMRNRVMAQFVTILCFVGYVGLEQFDLRMAPMYQDNRKAAAAQQAQAAAAAAGASSSSQASDKE